jgi:hypothetical protein
MIAVLNLWFLLFLLHTRGFIRYIGRDSYHTYRFPAVRSLYLQRFLSYRQSFTVPPSVSDFFPSLNLRQIIPESLQRRTEESLDIHLLFEHIEKNIQTTLGQKIFYFSQFSDAASINHEYSRLQELRSHKFTMPKIISPMNVWPLLNFVLSNATELPSIEMMVEFSHDVEYVIKLHEYLSQRSDLFSSYVSNISLPSEISSFFAHSFVLEARDPEEVSPFSHLRISSQNRRAKAISRPRFVLNFRKFPSLLCIYQKMQEVQKKIEKELLKIIQEKHLR